MKTYEEIASRLLERRDGYRKEQARKRKKSVCAAAVTVCACVTAVLTVILWQGEITEDTMPLITQGTTVPAVANPDEQHDTGSINSAGSTVIAIPEATETTYAVSVGIVQAVTSVSSVPIHTTIAPIEMHTSSTNTPVISETTVPGYEAIPYKYYDYVVTENSYSEYIGGKVIAAENISDKIDDVIVRGGWKTTDGSWISEEQLRAEVYTIVGVKPDTAVALKFLDKGEALTTTHYYVILNYDADTAVVKDYIIEPISWNTSGEE